MFQCRQPEFMLQFLKSYIRPTLEYGVQPWSPTDVGSSDLLERIQRRFTKCIVGLGRLSYTDRLQHLSLPSLKSRHTFLIACFVYKLGHNLIDIPLHKFGLIMSNTITCTSGLKLTVPRPLCTLFHNSFVFQAVFIWNNLTYSIITLRTFSIFVLLYIIICVVRLIRLYTTYSPFCIHFIFVQIK